MSRKRKESFFSNTCDIPTYRGATYFFNSTEEIIKYHKNQTKLGRYGRYSNPNWTEVEQWLAQLDHAEQALIFATGMNAIVTTMITFLESGDSVIFTGNCYRNIYAFFTTILSKFGLKSIPISTINVQDFEDNFVTQYNQLRPKIVFVEMPSNPHLYLVDLEKIRTFINDETLLIVDSSLSSPYNFNPLRFGADIVIHSCTKYLSGHGDIMAGSVAGRQELIDAIRVSRNIMGGIIDPECASLLNRSLHTFRIRMEHYNQVGMKLAQYLQESPYVEQVFYTGLNSHPQSHLAEKYLTGHGGVITFNLTGDFKSTAQFVDALEIPFMGSNFGTSNAMVEQCSVFTYYNYSQEEQRQLNITDNLVRLSVGYENVESIIADINNAFTHTFGDRRI